MTQTFVLFIFVLSLALPAHALDIPESVVALYVDKQFPKKMTGVTISYPKVKLLDGKAQFCGLARPILFRKDIEFCSTFVPKWNQENGSLVATSITLQSMAVPGASQQHQAMAVSAINSTVLPTLDGIEIYRVDNIIVRKVRAVTVKPGNLDITFF